MCAFTSLGENMQYNSYFYVFTGILSATGNGYVIYKTIKRKSKLKPPEFMTLNLAVFDFGISGETVSLTDLMSCC